MKIRHALLIIAGIVAFLLLVRPPRREVARIKPRARIAAEAPSGAWDSVAAVGADLWVTDKARGEIIVLGGAPRRELRRIGPAIGLREPNGIAAVPVPGDRTIVAVADATLGEVLVLTPGGAVEGRFGKGVLTRPVGLAAWSDDGARLLVTDQRQAGSGRVWLFAWKAGEAPVARWFSEIRGEVESVLALPDQRLAVAANETKQRLEVLRLESGAFAGTLGGRTFAGEPEGLAFAPRLGAVVAVDQTADGALLLLGPGEKVRVFASDPPLVLPDGIALAGDSLFVVADDREVVEYGLEDLIDEKETP